MDSRLIRRLIVDKLHDRTTYGVAVVVGTLISAHGQLMVPWIRSDVNPFTAFATYFGRPPFATLFSVVLAYALPFCVGIYSAVAAPTPNECSRSIGSIARRRSWARRSGPTSRRTSRPTARSGFFEAEGAEYLVAHAPTEDDEINIYPTRHATPGAAAE